jgi:hypothetical protein
MPGQPRQEKGQHGKDDTRGDDYGYDHHGLLEIEALRVSSIC